MFSRSVRIATLISLGFFAMSTSGYAMDTNIKVETFKPTNVTAPIAPTPLVINNADFMKTSLKDFKFKLIGPVNLSISEDYSKRHFKHQDTNTAKRVMSPYENSIGSSTYYSGTIAKTGFKFKF